MNSEQIKVKSGESVQDAWNRLVLWVESLKIVSHPSFRVREMAGGGLSIVSRTTTQFSHPFYTSAGVSAVSVSTGLVNGIIPKMKDQDTGKIKRLDNRDDSGKPIQDENPPRLELDLSKSSDDGRIFICARVEPPAGGADVELTSDNISIVQTDSPNGPSDGSGYYPVAMVYLSQDRKSIYKVFQVTHHNLIYRFQKRDATADELLSAPKIKTIGRHIFRAA